MYYNQRNCILIDFTSSGWVSVLIFFSNKHFGFGIGTLFSKKKPFLKLVLLVYFWIKPLKLHINSDFKSLCCVSVFILYQIKVRFRLRFQIILTVNNNNGYHSKTFFLLWCQSLRTTIYFLYLHLILTNYIFFPAS